MIRYIITLLSAIPIITFGQVTFVVTQVPDNTPEDATIYISGNFEGWTGGSEDYKLVEGGVVYAITLPQMTGTIQFKFTLGSWVSVEKGPNGKELANRTYTFGGNGDTVEVEIATWASIEGGGGSTATDNVSVLSDDFYIPQLDRTRRIWIYLPPGYDEGDTHYPVLYVHDGQNCFDTQTSFSGEWEMDETLNDLSTSDGIDLIVVAIDNGGSTRIDEYSPWVNPQYGGGEGEAYVDFIVSTLKPFIDSAYRTQPQAISTGILGSSMGGLISHYAALAYPQVFSKAGVFSPAFWVVADSTYSFGSSNGDVDDLRMYFLAGGQENGDVVGDAQLMIDTMTAGGFPESNTTLVVDPDARHNEAFWRTYFGDAIIWLFGENSSSSGNDPGTGMFVSKVYPNPALDHVNVEFSDTNMTYELRLFDTSGKMISSQKTRAKTTLDVSDLGPGLYTIEVTDGQQISRQKLLLH